MSGERPAVAIGHVRLHTADIARAARFFEALGMRPCMAWEGMAILELRGGTHLLLIQSADDIQPTLDPMFDLMVDDIEAFRAGLIESGIAAGEIAAHPSIAHRRFFVTDPDGRRVAIYSDHTEGRSV